MKIRVNYENKDTVGVVYHSNYLNFCERSRSEAFFSKGLSPVLESGHFVARKLTADFFRSAKLGDLLDIQTQLIDMRAASFTLRQTIYKDDEKIFELQILLAYIGFDGAVQRLNAEIKELILSLF